MQVLALIWGILAALGMLVGFFPCLGALNWLNIPFAIVGLILSVIAYSTSRDASKRGAMAGIVLCAIATVLGLIRLVAGGGVL